MQISYLVQQASEDIPIDEVTLQLSLQVLEDPSDI